MSYIKTFENFNTDSHATSIYVANPEAESLLINDEVFESLNSEGFYQGDNIEEAIEILKSAGFSTPEDFAVLEALGEVKFRGHNSTSKGTELYVDINGHRYGYSQKEGDLDIADVARKFEKMLQFSAGRALNWLKKHTVLTSGSKTTEVKDASAIKEGEEIEDEVVVDAGTEAPAAEAPKMDTEDVRHYMFFQNLKTIKSHIDMMMTLDQSEIDTLLDNGHDWAADHLATSKDDIEEVCSWLCANLK